LRFLVVALCHRVILIEEDQLRQSSLNMSSLPKTPQVLPQIKSLNLLAQSVSV